MTAIVLAGGFGTRLRHIVPDLPKPIAPVAGKPFLSFVLDWLSRNGVTHTILATGYLADKISDYFGGSYSNMRLSYSVETTPLLTGGAVKKALGLCDDDSVFVINGDTYFDVPLPEMKRQFELTNADAMLAVKEMRDFKRYGTLTIDNWRITEFREKGPCERGFINGGVCILKRRLFDGFPAAFSLETDLFLKHTYDLELRAYPCEGYFIDIGVQEDYERAQAEFATEVLL
ncbi:MAG: nucleotidyltransferase family protein [Synergistaceae bacterium]|nr:nucleotidyltransferase family protein [Synergistaceae bacterium]